MKVELIPKPVFGRHARALAPLSIKLALPGNRAKSLWSRPEVKKARRHTEVRREPFLPTTLIHGLCSRLQQKEVLGWVLVGWTIVMTFTAFMGGCAPTGAYHQDSLYPQSIQTVCLEMFDNRSFRRDVEYQLTDALAKRIESETPYKLQSDQNRADSVMTGQILSIHDAVLTIERETGKALEKEMSIEAVVSWKNLKTGELLLDNEPVTATASFSEFLHQDDSYAAGLAANRLAQRIVEQMETSW